MSSQQIVKVAWGNLPKKKKKKKFPKKWRHSECVYNIIVTAPRKIRKRFYFFKNIFEHFVIRQQTDSFIFIFTISTILIHGHRYTHTHTHTKIWLSVSGVKHRAVFSTPVPLCVCEIFIRHFKQPKWPKRNVLKINNEQLLLSVGSSTYTSTHAVKYLLHYTRWPPFILSRGTYVSVI
jgi:hypothetical protein